jgi:hypothetical protein
MSDRSQSPVAEFRELEERLAVRTARIDQLQAALESSQIRSLRLARTLMITGCVAGIPSALWGLQPPRSWTFDGLLAAIAVGLAAITALFSFAIDRHLRVQHHMAERVPWILPIFAACVRRSPSWKPFPISMSAHRRRFVGEVHVRAALWFFSAAFIAVGMVDHLGSIALAVFALLIVLGLLRLIWTRQASAPGMVQATALLVAVAAAFSVGSWAGHFYSGMFLRQHGAARVARGEQMTSKLTSEPRRQLAPSYQQLCSAPPPWSAISAWRPVLRLHEAWLSAGALAAGCAGPAYVASPGQEIVASIASDGGQFRSLGVADANHGAWLFGQAAYFVKELINDKRLHGVPVHLIVGRGDLYIVYTIEGTYVLMRRAGSYTAVPPALTNLWMGAMSRSGGWLWVQSAAASAHSRGFKLLNPYSVVVGRAWCDPSDRACEISTGGYSKRIGGGTPSRVSAEDVLRYAPNA